MQVKRLYDTFHEPFRKVLLTCPANQNAASSSGQQPAMASRLPLDNVLAGESDLDDD